MWLIYIYIINIYIYIYVCVCTHKWTVEWENHLVDFYGHVWLPESTLNEGTPDCNPPDISLIVPQDFQPSFRRSACNGLAANQKKNSSLDMKYSPESLIQLWICMLGVVWESILARRDLDINFQQLAAGLRQSPSYLAFCAWETSVCVCLLFGLGRLYVNMFGWSTVTE